MMPNVTLILRMHTPFVLAQHNALAPGEIIDVGATRRACSSFAKRSVLPVHQTLGAISNQLDTPFRFTCMVSGVALEIFETHCPQVIDSLSQLCQDDVIELAAMPYHHGLPFQIDPKALADEINAACAKVKALFGCDVRTFGNTDLIYNADVVAAVIHAGLEGIICAAPPQAMKPIVALAGDRLRMIAVDREMSGLVADHFSNTDFSEWPITAPKFAKNVAQRADESGGVALFWDYDQFGGKHSADTGVFEFLSNLPDQLLMNGIDGFQSCHDAMVTDPEVLDRGSLNEYEGWGGDFDSLAGVAGPSLSSQALSRLYSLQVKVLGNNRVPLEKDWRRLQDAEYFRLMDRRCSNHAGQEAFSGGLCGYEAYMTFMGHCDAIGKRLEG